LLKFLFRIGLVFLQLKKFPFLFL